MIARPPKIVGSLMAILMFTICASSDESRSPPNVVTLSEQPDGNPAYKRLENIQRSICEFEGRTGVILTRTNAQ